MKFCFIVASMDKRIPFLNKCIDAYRNSKYSDCDIFLYFQGDKIDDVKGKEIFTEIVIDPKPRGVFTPRYELMKRFCGDYDYTILIDDDLYITEETCFEKTCKFMEAYKHVGCSTTMNRRQFIKNKIEIVPFGDEINVQGGLVIRREAVLEIVEYFKDKEADYTFDCF